MRETPLSYYPNAHAVVCDPAQTFPERLKDAIRQVRCTAKIRTESDRRLLTDIADGKGLVRFERLADITRTCTDPGDATAIAECFRGYALSSHRGLTATEALRYEAEADGAEDQAVFEFLSNRCQATRLRAIEALRRAIETSQAAINALHQEVGS